MKQLRLIGCVIVIVALFSFPFVFRLFTFYNDTSEYVLQGFILLHNYESITSGNLFDADKHFQMRFFEGHPFSLAFMEHMFFPSVLFWLIYSITGVYIFSVNSVSFLTLCVSFLASFSSAFYFLRKYFPSIIAAIIFTFNPLANVNFPDALDIVITYFIPLIFLFWILFLRKPTWKTAFLFSFFFALNGMSSVHFTVLISVMLFLCTLSMFFYPSIRSTSLTWKHIQYLLPSILLVLPVMMFFLLPYLRFSVNMNAKRSIEENIHYSARLVDWISPNPQSLLYGKLVQKTFSIRNPKEPNGFFNWYEHTLFPGVIPIILAIFGIFFIVKNHTFRKKYRLFITFYGLLLLLSFLFTFGPYFTGINSDRALFPLPYKFIREVFLPLQGLRTPDRFAYIFFLPFSLLCGVGTMFLIARFVRRKRMIMLIIFFLIFAEFVQTRAYEDRSEIITKYSEKKFSFLRDASTLHYPIYVPDMWGELGYLNWAVITGERMVNGHSGYFPPDWVGRMLYYKRLGLETLRAQIRRDGVRFITVHKNELNSAEQIILEELKQYGLYEDDEIIILSTGYLER